MLRLRSLCFAILTCLGISLICTACALPPTPAPIPTSTLIPTSTVTPTPAPILQTVTILSISGTPESLPGFPDIKGYLGTGVYTNTAVATSPQEFAVRVSGVNRDVVSEYLRTTQFYFVASSISKPESSPTDNAPNKDDSLSLSSSLGQSPNSLIIEFDYLPAGSKPVFTLFPPPLNYEITYIIDPRITSDKGIHNYPQKNKASARVTIKITGDNGSLVGKLYRGCSRVDTTQTLSLTGVTSGPLSNNNCPYSSCKYDLLIQGIKTPIKYELTGSSQTWYGSEATPATTADITCK
jgi:hypothetical protein